MPVTAISTDYAGRQVDVELLQSITAPTGLQAVTLSTVTKQPKIVTGIEKAIQRYTHLFLSVLGDMMYDTQQGCDFIRGVTTGAVQTRGGLQQYFALSNAQVLAQLTIDNADTAIYGSIPSDEIIISVALKDFTVDYSTGTVMMQLEFTFQSGDNVTFTIPVAAPR